MRCNFGIRSDFESGLQQLQRPCMIAQTELDPAQAVGDERVLWRKRQGFLHQLFGFLQPLAPVGERVAQSVISMVVVGLACDQLTQHALHGFKLPCFFCQHGLVVKQVIVFRELRDSLCL